MTHAASSGMPGGASGPPGAASLNTGNGAAAMHHSNFMSQTGNKDAIMK